VRLRVFADKRTIRNVPFVLLVSATGPDGNVLKIRPPLVFQREHADVLLQALDEVLAG